MESPDTQFRLLLDQNFPTPVIDLSTVDATVTVISIDAFDRSLTKKRTPDWLIYLRAVEAGFDAVVTRDRSQLDDAEEMVALAYSGLNVVTWRESVEDPIQEWGQLLAYMGPIKTRLRGRHGLIILLPRPMRGKDRVLRARRLVYEMAAEQRTSFPELRDEARRLMMSELEERGRPDLAHLVQGWRLAPPKAPA